MTGYVRRNLPADITVFAGDFDSQPLAFAHLLDEAPDLALDHVEVISGPQTAPRLNIYFQNAVTERLITTASPYETLILILPAAYDGLICPLTASEHLVPLGVHRGTVPRMVATEGGA